MAVALCGNAGGMQTKRDCLAFYSEKHQLIGIDSVNVPIDQRLSLWQQMADLQIADELVVQEITLDQLPGNST